MTPLGTVRAAVRRFLDQYDPGADHAVAVACSGGADSLALAAAAVHTGRPVAGLVVDHRLQPGSDAVAAHAADLLRTLGCADVRVLTVDVPATANLEAAARAARYTALAQALADGRRGALVLLGHTLDDQAETVLLGLGRGSGARSIAGMRVLDLPWARPLLGVRRADTVAACAELGLTPWSDPHNADPRFRRARLRAEVLPLLEDVLAGGVAPALARTAAQLREDCDALDALAADLRTAARAGPDPAHRDDGALDVRVLAASPAAVRRRAVRTWLLERGVAELSDAHLRAVDALVGDWHGQGAVALPGDLDARRHGGRLEIAPRRGGLGAVRAAWQASADRRG